MDEAGKYEHALIAVLYAVKKAGGNLDDILESAKQGMIGNSLRPRPQDQDAVIKAIEKAMSDIEPIRRIKPSKLPRPGPAPGEQNKPCMSCDGKGEYKGEECNTCAGTGTVPA